MHFSVQAASLNNNLLWTMFLNCLRADTPIWFCTLAQMYGWLNRPNRLRPQSPWCQVAPGWEALLTWLTLNVSWWTVTELSQRQWMSIYFSIECNSICASLRSESLDIYIWKPNYIQHVFLLILSLDITAEAQHWGYGYVSVWVKCCMLKHLAKGCYCKETNCL